MTYKLMQKIRQSPVNGTLIIAVATGAIEGLLLARLVARLLAARPDNPSIQLLHSVTGPLVAPLSALNYAQPPFGAALELATLIMATLVPLGAYLAWVLLRSTATGAGGKSS